MNSLNCFLITVHSLWTRSCLDLSLSTFCFSFDHSPSTFLNDDCKSTNIWFCYTARSRIYPMNFSVAWSFCSNTAFSTWDCLKSYLAFWVSAFDSTVCCLSKSSSFFCAVITSSLLSDALLSFFSSKLDDYSNSCNFSSFFLSSVSLLVSWSNVFLYCSFMSIYSCLSL